MNWADYFIIILIALSALIGLWRGLLREVISLTTWIAAIGIAFLFAEDGAAHLTPYIEIPSLRLRTHWNISNITPIDPVALGLCRQSELDAAVQKAAKKKAADGAVMSDDERRKLVSTEQSLGMSTEPKMPSSIAGLANFSLTRPEEDEEKDPADYSDADSFFNLPHGDEEDEDEDDAKGRR